MKASLWTPKPDGLVGKPVKRFEDDRLLRGQGQYIADLALDGMVHMAVVRSLYPHARILGIETAAAMAMPLGWLVCRCDDRRAAQLALLGAVGNVVGAKAALLPQTAPLLKALWEAEVVDEAVVGEWAKADGGGGKAQRWAQPFVDWLREVPEAEAETE